MRDNIVKQCSIPELRFTERSTTIIGSQGGVQLLQCITDYKGVVSSQTDGEEPVGFALVPERSKNSARMTRTVSVPEQERIREIPVHLTVI